MYKINILYNQVRDPSVTISWLWQLKMCILILITKDKKMHYCC